MDKRIWLLNMSYTMTEQPLENYEIYIHSILVSMPIFASGVGRGFDPIRCFFILTA